MLLQIQIDSTQQELIKQIVASASMAEAFKPLFAVALFFGNGLLYLPECLLPIKKWREMLLRFISDDDGQLNKADMKDASINWASVCLCRFGLHVVTYDLLFQAEHNEAIYTLLAAAGLFWTGNMLIHRSAKN